MIGRHEDPRNCYPVIPASPIQDLSIGHITASRAASSRWIKRRSLPALGKDPNQLGSHHGKAKEQQTPPTTAPPGWGRSVPALGSRQYDSHEPSAHFPILRLFAGLHFRVRHLFLWYLALCLGSGQKMEEHCQPFPFD